MVALDLIGAIIAILIPAIATVAWFVRLESRINMSEKELKRIEAQTAEKFTTQKEKDAIIWTKIDDIQKAINSLLQMVGRMEGKIESQKEQ